MLEAATESAPETPPPGRLIIRIDLTPAEPPPPPAPPRFSKSALLVIVGVVAALIAWLGFSVFKSDPTPPAASIAASPASSTSSAASKPTAETTAAPSIATPPAAARTVAPPPDAPTTAVNEVLPTVSQSSLNTIRGTIRVSVRVTLDKQGTVTNATATDAGPSRYFARLAVNASKQWTFTPATAEAQRTMLVQFNFTRSGVTAHANPAT